MSSLCVELLVEPCLASPTIGADKAKAVWSLS